MAKKSYSNPIMIMHAEDNVGVCLRELKTGGLVNVQHNKKDLHLKILDQIPLGHKVAITGIRSGNPIIKYGEIIGKATKAITAGQHVHVHNVTDN